MTEFPGPNAHMHGHSEGTVKLAKAHCDSTYCPRKLIFDNLECKQCVLRGFLFHCVSHFL